MTKKKKNPFITVILSHDEEITLDKQKALISVQILAAKNLLNELKNGFGWSRWASTHKRVLPSMKKV
jgi:hypothetical protein